MLLLVVEMKHFIEYDRISIFFLMIFFLVENIVSWCIILKNFPLIFLRFRINIDLPQTIKHLFKDNSD